MFPGILFGSKEGENCIYLRVVSQITKQVRSQLTKQNNSMRQEGQIRRTSIRVCLPELELNLYNYNNIRAFVAFLRKALALIPVPGKI